jgi:hypothetical protein
MKIKEPLSEAEARYRTSLIRKSLTRGQTKYSAGGREKRKTRPVPSLPQLKCLQLDADAPLKASQD